MTIPSVYESISEDLPPIRWFVVTSWGASYEVSLATVIDRSGGLLVPVQEVPALKHLRNYRHFEEWEGVHFDQVGTVEGLMIKFEDIDRVESRI